MKQVCPSCLKSVEVPESAAGTDYPCLVCGSQIPVPRNYSPSVAVPPPPPVEKPPPPPGLAPPAPSTPPTPPPPPGDENEVGITVSSTVLEWLPAIGLTLAFVLTFFTWVGSYPGGHRLFSQNAWEAVGASYTPTGVPADLEDVEKKLYETLVRANWWLLVYVVALAVALFFAWADRLLPNEITPTTVPGPLVWLIKFWPMRRGLLLVLGLALVGLLLLQSWKGLGLDNALREYAAAKYDEEVKAADVDLKKTAARVKVGQEYAKFAVQWTTWFALAFWVHVAVAAALALRVRAHEAEIRPVRLSVRY